MNMMDVLLNRAAQRNLPATGTLELTARCNLSCKMCYIHNMACDKHLIKEELSTEQWIGIMDQLQSTGTMPLLLTGGEPLLRPDFPTLYMEAVKRGFLISINTNGTLLTEEHFELFAKHKPLRPLKEEVATHASILACRIPETEESGGLQSMGLQRIRHG